MSKEENMYGWDKIEPQWKIRDLFVAFLVGFAFGLLAGIII